MRRVWIPLLRLQFLEELGVRKKKKKGRGIERKEIDEATFSCSRFC